MGQPVKLSDNLVVDARLAGEIAERSINSQIEYWARLGRAIDVLLRADQVMRLKQRGDARTLSDCIAAIDTDEGRARTRAYLASRPYPHFEASPDRPGSVVRIDEDGTRTIGRFVGRRFVPA